MTDYAELWQDIPNYSIRKSEDLLPLFIDKPMDFPKGTEFKYSNSGYVVLGLIIEAISAESFDTYLKTELFSTIGMNATGYYELDCLPEKCATAYIWDDNNKKFYSNIYSIDAKGSGAGGAFTTVEDMQCFWKNLTTNKILPASITNQIFKSKVSNNYSYGFWFIEDEKNRKIPYLMGFDPGVRFISSYDLEEKMTITILSNTETRIDQLYKEIQKELNRIE